MSSFPIPVHDDDHSSMAFLSSFSSMPSLVDGASIIEDDLADGGNGLLVTLASSGYSTIPHVILFIDRASTPTSIDHPSHITMSITPFQQSLHLPSTG